MNGSTSRQGLDYEGFGRGTEMEEQPTRRKYGYLQTRHQCRVVASQARNKQLVHGCLDPAEVRRVLSSGKCPTMNSSKGIGSVKA